MKKQVTLNGTVEKYTNTIGIEFGKVQADMEFSSRGKAARTLKLKDGDKVEVTIKKK